MDERLMKRCIGKPVPEWDMAHRLQIDRPVGPDIQDTGALFRVNSCYLDAIEPLFLEKQLSATAAVIAFIAIGTGPYVYGVVHDGTEIPIVWSWIFDCLAVIASAGCTAMAWMAGRGLFFGLRRYPVRFHRGERKLYAIRRRRFRARPGQGDVVWEIPWSSDSIFCLHREMSTFGEVFHIRHYTVNGQGKVTRVFSIGCEWSHASEIELALAQWNYWCKYMDDGPANLPKPMLFHTENETSFESFLFSLYDLGLSAPVIWRIVMLPFILVFTLMRVLANATCRNPVWPDSIERISQVAADDPYAEPRPGTPVGWAQTVRAQQRGEYPDNPRARTKNWHGETDGEVHAAAWLKDPSVPDRPAKAS